MPGESRCSPREIQSYLNRISGPLLDRIDLHVEVPAVKFRDIASARPGESSAQIRERVVAARQRQQRRLADRPRVTCNARMGTRELKQFCALDEATGELLKVAMAEYNLSARALRSHPESSADHCRSRGRGSHHRRSRVRGHSVPHA